MIGKKPYLVRSGQVKVVSASVTDRLDLMTGLPTPGEVIGRSAIIIINRPGTSQGVNEEPLSICQ